jgi:hypothetical protein
VMLGESSDDSEDSSSDEPDPDKDDSVTAF